MHFTDANSGSAAMLPATCLKTVPPLTKFTETPAKTMQERNIEMPLSLIRHGQSEFSAAHTDGSPDPMIFDAPIAVLAGPAEQLARAKVVGSGESGGQVRPVSGPRSRR
jgi:hypothetical protein